MDLLAAFDAEIQEKVQGVVVHPDPLYQTICAEQARDAAQIQRLFQTGHLSASAAETYLFGLQGR